ncbi:respiratory nitrate reductase subunit gamma [Caldivirga sp. UBA161]|uniref:respiratory nitrate reductase subunit gamma n=1 Tax=Caldivirga sp. UBA161 TaxID=1915569 RepID=UPI0025C0BA3C|nr:respiratory nitrate reductase subunit gamma [Caldivirga sp. UBA161]
MLTQLLRLTAYAAVLIFIAGIAYRWRKWSSMPTHLRWELYPVPHEPPVKVRYGGGYLEEELWWSKERTASVIGELKELLSEMLFIKRIYNNNKRLWALTYPFHLGIYLILVWFLLILLGAVTEAYAHILVPSSNAWSIFLYYTTAVVGVAGALLAVAGGIGLLIRRLTSPVLRDYTTIPDYFNLLIVLLALTTGLASWFNDPFFNYARAFALSLVNPLVNPPPLNAVILIHVTVLQLLVAYIPFSKITHFIGKYFTYHRVLWDDEPGSSGLNRRVGELMQLKMPWNAPHIKPNESWEDNAEVITNEG